MADERAEVGVPPGSRSPLIVSIADAQVLDRLVLHGHVVGGHTGGVVDEEAVMGTPDARTSGTGFQAEEPADGTPRSVPFVLSAGTGRGESSSRPPMAAPVASRQR